MQPQNRVLVEGDDVSPWATMKLARANEHFNDFFARVLQWNASRVYRAPMRISEDRCFVEFLQPVGTRPPVEEWGLLFGDAVHNMRAALDGIVWDFAHLDGATPDNPGRVGFPVLQKRREWKDAASRLSTIPSDLLERIESLQPFNSGDSVPEMSWLSIVSRLDNDDKHRGVVVGVPLLDHVRMEGMNVRLGDTPPGLEGQFETAFNLDEVTDGKPFARFSFGALIEPGSSLPNDAVVDMGAAVRYLDQLIPVAAVHGEGLTHINRVLHFLRTGSYPESGTVIEPDRFEPATSP